MLHSPVSRWALSARAYLATVMILMLVLTGAHFAIQVWGQTQAEQWVNDWEEQYGGHVGDVRLRMLRGALTLSDVRWDDKGVSFELPYLLLRGNVSDSSSQVEIREIDMRGGKLTLPKSMLQQMLMEKSVQTWLPWRALLKHLRKTHGKAFTLVLHEDDISPTNHRELTLTKVSFSGEPAQNRWHLDGRLFAGHVNIKHRLQQTDTTWKGVDSKRFFRSLGLYDLKGSVEGSSIWNGKDWTGKMQWHAEHASESAQSGKLAWRAAIKRGKWQADVHSVHWPLQVFAAYAPSLDNHLLQSAYLKGLIHVRVNKQGWQLKTEEGVLSDVLYQYENQPLWQFEKVNFSQAEMRWPQREMHVKHIDFQGGIGSIHIHSDKALKPKLAWKVNLPNIGFSHMKYGDIGHDFWVSELEGEASLKNNILKADASSDTPVMGQWRIQLSGKPEALNIRAHASDVPLLIFRDYIPSRLSEDAGLNGLVELDLQGLWGDEQWHMQGNANASDVIWNKGSWLWKAKRMGLKQLSFGSSGDVKVGDWQINDWSGQTSLHPWMDITASEDVKMDEHQAFWLQGWQVDTLTAKNGIFSLGQDDAVWLRAQTLSLKSIKQGKALRMKIVGKLADGRLWMSGTWFPWGDAPWFALKSSLRDALPFVAAPWLQVSGLPIFTQGRMSARLRVKSSKKSKDYYQGLLGISLRNTKIEQGVFSNQGFSQSTGYAPDALFERIAPNGNVDLSIPLQGSWKGSPLNWATLGQSLLKALADKGSKPSKAQQESQFVHLSNIRLHTMQQGKKDSLKHNERVRLRKVISVLKREKTWRLELVPQLGDSILNDTLVDRIHYTQKQIEQFLIARGISAERIFPIWPEEASRQGTSTGILIQAVK